MNSFIKKITGIFLAGMMMIMVGCASTAKQESAGEYIDDTVITTKVKAAIVNEPTLKATEINVETYKGVVQLSGFVADPASSSKAVSVTSGIKGVKSVKNDIRVK
ncbi:BON domain-containing protein [Undibacterium pigrum]|uniref:Osmotically-inducible protein Y n=1 Tax=Undibacterium pigrum TaxID=401470 RepID=A0A318J940_9BURK|nr:BON domain-containing protein [Undibacterium pigrum]PXX43027.1 hyperosmotically inducible protein [Undibacterium pigrum]